MSRDEIMTLDLEQLEERAAQIETDSVGIDEERLLEFNTELEAIEERRAAIMLEIETRKKEIAEVAKGVGDVIEQSV